MAPDTRELKCNQFNIVKKNGSFDDKCKQGIIQTCVT